jgi:hypothetical protein
VRRKFAKLISGAVAVPIVDGFKIIEVENYDAEREPVPSRLAEKSAEPRLDQLEIGKEIVDDQNPCGHAMGVPAFLHAGNTSLSRHNIHVTIAP